MSPARGAVGFPVRAEVALDYLVDPRNRPQWQSSLRGVEVLDDEVGVGQRWIDVTWPGMRPRMETVLLDRPRAWAERGAWRGFTAYLRLDVREAGGGCLVDYEFEVTGQGWLAPVGRVLTTLARPAVRADLRRAARRCAGVPSDR